MTKADLVEKVTATIARTAGPMISKKDCARVVDAFLDAVKQSLSEQQNIEIRGFGIELHHVALDVPRQSVLGREHR